MIVFAFANGVSIEYKCFFVIIELFVMINKSYIQFYATNYHSSSKITENLYVYLSFSYGKNILLE